MTQVVVNQLVSAGILLIGIGVIGGSIATTQGLSVAVLPSVSVIVVGIAVIAVGKYR
jgi:hypothetical protein